MNKKFEICVCASAGGGNFQSLIDAQDELGFKITSLIVDRDCFAIKRSEEARIPVIKVKNTDSELVELFNNNEKIMKNDLIVLAGFMPIIPKIVCIKWSGRMINTHPSLLPKFGGKGMYGVKVQEAVLAAGENYAGSSIHFVSSEIDGGEVILQEKIKINKSESAWELGGRVFEIENKLLVQAVKIIMNQKRRT